MYQPDGPKDPFVIARKWEEHERAIDSKVDDFGYIVLSDNEYKILKQADKMKVLITDSNKTDVERLSLLNFAKKQDNYCCIRERGRSYLRYYQNECRKMRIGVIHDWKIALFSVFGAAFLTALAWKFLKWIASILFQLAEKLK